ncbi:hypothetical protein [Stackebrandtia soli]|uniref:hypothetical protein n=1 Tax=Stackebrandtia soli TaxID=1892856 RepID=UPI0039EAEBF5
MSTKDDEPDRDQPDDTSESGKPELDAAEVDERFAAMIADFNDSPEWPDADEEEDDEPPRTRDDSAARLAHPSQDPSLLDLWDADLGEDDDEPEENYEPPPPPPVPRPSAPAILGVLLIVGGLTLFISPELLDVGSDLGRLTGMAAFIGGVAMLIWRLRPEPEDEDDDPGNGAVV